MERVVPDVDDTGYIAVCASAVVQHREERWAARSHGADNGVVVAEQHGGRIVRGATVRTTCMAWLQCNSGSPSTPGAVDHNSPEALADQLRKLAQLRREGVITEEQSDAQRTKLLG